MVSEEVCLLYTSPCVQDAEYFRDAFLAVQELVNKGLILAGHDISAGGLITTLLEMCFGAAPAAA